MEVFTSGGKSNDSELKIHSDRRTATLNYVCDVCHATLSGYDVISANMSQDGNMYGCKKCDWYICKECKTIKVGDDAYGKLLSR